MARSTLRAGMLATAVMVGRKTAGGARTSDGRGTRAGGSDGSQGFGAAAGGGPSADHGTDPRADANGDRGRGADTPQEIPAKGWKDIAKRTGKEVKADQVPLLAAGVAFYTLLALFPAIIAGVSIYGLVADPQTVRDQINQLAQTLSPETATLIGSRSSRSPAAPAAPSGWPPSSAS
jgi:membrane protein